jgi:hypothetical protein
MPPSAHTERGNQGCLVGVTNLYTLGFLVIGLIFFLSHLGSMVSWWHYLAQSNEARSLTGDRGIPLYEVISQVAPCMGGLGAVIMAPRLGRMLASRHAADPKHRVLQPQRGARR